MMKKTFLLFTLLSVVSIASYCQDAKHIKSATEQQLSPEDLAQAQLVAYNNKDLEAFLAVYSNDIEIYYFPNELIYSGKDEMRKVYSEFFSKAGDLHCKLVNRITYGNYVMDREYVTTSIPGREVIEGQAIYEVKDGKIIKVWFMKM
ncbi:MAG: SnoaL-like domain-containing protein [Bacteroidetes bacterium]|jgi:hypothetical protein|nr:SnoaL-like domain-containing protein [Bacteroidota bacterium]MBT3935968.1 SnoaL-like domain-containing protein [Bacteroidota bacterium]MBT4728208.1 SnoaL-like domain-containing protein [Bacteroidota bacterium]MBT6835019.1 SnoaL-like domain-containing protein [Bacteroidota bacterium]MBT7039211.1 SnoaL-like domain-containing protein [Bacteroidota bacterium]